MSKDHTLERHGHVVLCQWHRRATCGALRSQLDTFFREEPTISRPDNLQRAADPSKPRWNFSGQWQALSHVEWLQRVGKVKGELLTLPNYPLEPVIGEPRWFVEILLRMSRAISAAPCFLPESYPPSRIPVRMGACSHELPCSRHQLLSNL